MTFREEFLGKGTLKPKREIKFNYKKLIGFFIVSCILLFLGFTIKYLYTNGIINLGELGNFVNIMFYIFIFNFIFYIGFLYVNIVGIIESIEIVEFKSKKNKRLVNVLDNLNI